MQNGDWKGFVLQSHRKFIIYTMIQSFS